MESWKFQYNSLDKGSVCFRKDDIAKHYCLSISFHRASPALVIYRSPRHLPSYPLFFLPQTTSGARLCQRATQFITLLPPLPLSEMYLSEKCFMCAKSNRLLGPTSCVRWSRGGKKEFPIPIPIYFVQVLRHKCKNFADSFSATPAVSREERHIAGEYEVRKVIHVSLHSPSPSSSFLRPPGGAEV